MKGNHTNFLHFYTAIKKGQVYKYNVKKWVKSRRIIFHKDLNRNFTDQVRDSETEATHENNLKPSPQYVAASNSIENSSWFDDSYENFEMDLDNDERISRKKANRKKGKQNTEDKLFFCDKCGAKYKTKQRMGYHMEKSHGKLFDTLIRRSRRIVKINSVLFLRNQE